MTKRHTIEAERRALALFEGALDQPSDTRSDWIAAQDAEAAVKARALAMLNVHRLHELRTGGAMGDSTPMPAPERIGAYRITATIGSGGMGTVYRGERDTGDFTHVVAIKLVKPGLLSASLQARFRRERQLLAGLAHPNIARLYDGGETKSGQPYFVMEYVDGRSIPAWMAEEAPSLPAKMALFRQICEAVAYAHQQLIIHRDLTPSNILVDGKGNARLIDFGIARPHELERNDAAMSPATESVSAAAASVDSLTLTPGYAAPERSIGGGATTLSDVFSLGRILSDMLSGESDAELSAIAAKAAAGDPAARYSTVAALGEDVARWHNGLAVKAMPSTRQYRLTKFIARNRPQMALGAALLFAIVAGLFATSWQWNAAARARDEAETRFSDTRSIARFMLFDLYDKIQPIAGSTAALEQIATRSRTYLERLDDGRDLPPELQFEIAAGYHRLSLVVGNPMGRNLGRRAESRLHMDRALALLKPLVEANPDNVQYLREYGSALFSNAILLYVAEEVVDPARESALLSAATFDRIVRLKPDDTAAKIAAIDSRVQAAKTLGDIDKQREGIAEMQALVAPMEAIVREHPDDIEAQIMLADVYGQIGNAMAWTYDPKGPEYPQAITALDKSMAILDRLLADPATRAKSERPATLSLWFRSMALSDLLRFPEALVDLERAEAILDGQMAKDPDDKELPRRHESMGYQKAFVLFDMGRRSEAIVLAKSIADSRKARMESEPTNAGFSRDFAGITATYIQFLFRDGQTVRGCAAIGGFMVWIDRLEKRKIFYPKDRMLYVDKMQEYAKTCPA